MRWTSLACASACALLMTAAPAAAQSIAAKASVPSGSVATQACSWTDITGVQNLCSAQTPLPVTIMSGGFSGGGGGGGGAVTASAGAFQDGAIVGLGSLADAPWTGSGGASEISTLKGIYQQQATASGQSTEAGYLAALVGQTKGSTAIAPAQVSVGTASTPVVAARTGRVRVTFSIGAANTCAFGNSGVTLTTGFPLQPVAGATLTLDTTAAIYAVCSATTTISAMELY